MSEQDIAGFGTARLVDLFSFAAGRGAMAGETPVMAFGRLADQLAERGGTVRWRLRGELDADGRPRLTVEVSGQLALRCQRCLAALQQPLAIVAVLQPVRSGEDLPENELENDEVDAIEVDGEVDALSLVEDEILLALPIAPRHEDCGALRRTETDEGAGGKSPFAVLAGLRGRNG